MKPAYGKKGILLILSGLLISGVLAILQFKDHLPPLLSGKEAAPVSLPLTFDDIVNAGEITVITRNNAHCYYLYRDEPMGFEYDLMSEFAKYLGVEMKVRLAEQWEDIAGALSDGKCAFAAGMTITSNKKKTVAFSDGYMNIRQHVITRRKYPKITGPHDLAKKTVHVRKGSPYHDMLQMFISRGIPIKLVIYENASAEHLIRMVAEGAIDITVANSNIALLNRRYYPDIQIAAAISDDQEIGWAVSPSAAALKDRINSFFRMIRKNGKYTEIYNRYYANIENYSYGDIQDFHEKLSTTLPVYIDWIRDGAEANGLDWRLIAAMMYQESRYNPKICSSSGACGLMQLMKTSAQALQVNDIFDPEQNISAGIRHFRGLYDFFDKAEGEDRIYLALAAYNAGQGHVMDARNIAKEMNMNPEKWASLSKTLPLLSDEDYYRKAVYGYCRGEETVDYIRKVRDYYDILKKLNDDFPSS